MQGYMVVVRRKQRGNLCPVSHARQWSSTVWILRLNPYSIKFHNTPVIGQCEILEEFILEGTNMTGRNLVEHLEPGRWLGAPVLDNFIKYCLYGPYIKGLGIRRHQLTTSLFLLIGLNGYLI